MYTHIHIFIVYIYIYICTHTHTHASIHPCMHACMHTYVRMYVHTYVRTYVHTYMSSLTPEHPTGLEGPRGRGEGLQRGVPRRHPQPEQQQNLGGSLEAPMIISYTIL